MQRPSAVITPYGSTSDTIDIALVRTPTTRQGNGWLLRRGFEDSTLDLHYLIQPSTVVVFYRTSPEMPVQHTRLSTSGDLGGVGYCEISNTGLIVGTYDTMILDSVVLFNDDLNEQDEQDFVKIPPRYQTHLVDTINSGVLVSAPHNKTLLIQELPKSLTGNRYYQILIRNV